MHFQVKSIAIPTAKNGVAMTVLQACLKVLSSAEQPLSVRELLHEIEKQNLYAFKAQDRAKVISSAIRNNLKNDAPIIKEVEKGKYTAAST
jgi:HB1, ASXL, restriction endonuclease HTH domain